MSTISANPFALLGGGDSDDEGGAPRTAPVKSTKAPDVGANQPKKTIPGQQVKRDRNDYPPRGGARKVYGGQSGGNDAEAPGGKPAGVTDSGRDDRGERRGGGPRGGRGGRGRGAGRGRGGGRFDERPDRHSATGTHDTDRKVASGWGAEEGKQELQAETEGWGDAKADMAPAAADDAWGTNAADGDAPVANGNTKEAEEPKEEEEEDKTKTFEEYLAEKANAISGLPDLKKDIRKPNEGVDDSQWKNAVKLVKGEEDEEVFFQASKEKKVSQTNKKVKEKTYIEVEPVGYRPPRTGGDRGGRGRGRGRGGDRDFQDRGDFNDNRGASRGGRGRGSPRATPGGHLNELNTEDANAFPSLS